MTKKLIAVLLIVCMIFSICACGKKEEKDTSFTVVDQFDREVAFDKPAEKIVVTSAGDCEILCAIGAQSLIVGRGTYCDYPETIAEVPAVGSSYNVNAEEIIALSPDVVVFSDLDYNEDVISTLEASGIKVVLTNADTIEEVYEAILLLGKVTGNDENAEALVANMRAGFAQVVEASEDTGKTCYFEVSPLEWGLWTAGKGTFMDEIATMLGLTNVFNDVDGWASISEEQVITRNPDYIFTITMYYGEGPRPEEEIMARKGWEGITAVKDAHVFTIDSNSISRPSPRLVDAIKELSDLIK